MAASRHPRGGVASTRIPYDMTSCTLLTARLGLTLLLALTLPAATAAAELTAQLRQLAQAEGFTVSGLDKLQDTPAGSHWQHRRPRPRLARQ
jgi:hypothetical protein